MTQIMSKEEKTARKLAEAVTDITLDIHLVGFYLGHFADYAVYDRLMLIAHDAQTERELQDDRFGIDPLF
jgi:hypothetical protein